MNVTTPSPETTDRAIVTERQESDTDRHHDREPRAPVVLVVDDNEDNRAVLTRMLEHGGYSVTQAGDGLEALDKATSETPALILMDLSMPGMDGWTATGRLKAEPELCQIPVIVVTGHLTRDEIERAQRVGCQDIVSKPIDYYVLIDKIGHHLATVPRSV